MGFIYSIRHIQSKKQYIGSSTQIKKRKSRHFSDLRNNRHYNAYLQRAFNKYGEEAFEWVILESVDNCIIDKKEKDWIISEKSHIKKYGYNATSEPYAPMRGKKVSPEVLAKKKMPKGSEHANSKINESVVELIFDLHKKGWNQLEIAEKVKINHSNVSLILTGKAWKHCSNPPIKYRTNNTSGCVGVYYIKNANKWKAEIIKNKKYYNLGIYDSKEKAIESRKKAEGGHHRV